MTVEPFRPEHFAQLQLQAQHERARNHLDERALNYLAGAGPAYTARLADGTILGVTGLDETNGHFSFLWCLLSTHARSHMVTVLRTAMRLLSIASRPVVYASTEPDFAPGCRLLGLLGFQLFDGPPWRGPDGSLQATYFKVIR